MKTNGRPIRGRASLTITFAVALAGQAAAVGFRLDAEARAKIDAEARRLIEEHHAPGLAIGIMSGGEILYARGFGSANLEDGAEVTPDTVFMIGSITKQFTAAAIVMLAEQGKLKIDDPISLYFPDFPRGGEAAIRHLLTHTSGIHPIMGQGTPLTPERAATLRSTADVIAWIRGLPDLYGFDPGTSYQYSNSGYWLLGAIVEQVSGLTLGDFLKRNLFDRAGMASTAMDDETEVVPNRAAGYLRAEGASSFTRPRPLPLGVRGGAGGIRSTVGDMLRWQDALLSGRIVSPEGVKAMTTPREVKGGGAAPPGLRNAPQYGFGLGLGEENGHAFVGHNGGSSQGFTAHLKAYPGDRVAFVVLTNVGVSPGAPPPDQGPRLSEEGAPPPPRGPLRRLRRPGGAAREVERFLSEMIAGPQQAGPE